MVGNDVVDLLDPESAVESIHPRFDARVFTTPEREQLEYSGDSARERWALWAAKEAAYKLMKRERPETIFSPRRFVVVLPPAASSEDAGTAIRRVGSVEHAGTRLHLTVEQDAECVHAVARSLLDEGWLELHGFRALSSEELAAGDPALPSLAARRLAIDAFAEETGLDAAALSIETTERIPRLVQGGRELAALSLSHHGRFVAFAGALQENLREHLRENLERLAS